MGYQWRIYAETVDGQTTLHVAPNGHEVLFKYGPVPYHQAVVASAKFAKALSKMEDSGKINRDPIEYDLDPLPN